MNQGLVVSVTPALPNVSPGYAGDAHLKWQIIETTYNQAVNETKISLLKIRNFWSSNDHHCSETHHNPLGVDFTNFFKFTCLWILNSGGEEKVVYKLPLKEVTDEEVLKLAEVLVLNADLCLYEFLADLRDWDAFRLLMKRHDAKLCLIPIEDCEDEEEFLKRLEMNVIEDGLARKMEQRLSNSDEGKRKFAPRVFLKSGQDLFLERKIKALEESHIETIDQLETDLKKSKSQNIETSLSLAALEIERTNLFDKVQNLSKQLKKYTIDQIIPDSSTTIDITDNPSIELNECFGTQTINLDIDIQKDPSTAINDKAITPIIPSSFITNRRHTLFNITPPPTPKKRRKSSPPKLAAAQEETESLRRELKDCYSRLDARDMYLQNSIVQTAKYVADLETKVVDLQGINSRLEWEFSNRDFYGEDFSTQTDSLDIVNMQTQTSNMNHHFNNNVETQTIPIIEIQTNNKKTQTNDIDQLSRSQLHLQILEREIKIHKKQLSYANHLVDVQEQTIDKMEQDQLLKSIMFKTETQRLTNEKTRLLDLVDQLFHKLDTQFMDETGTLEQSTTPVASLFLTSIQGFKACEEDGSDVSSVIPLIIFEGDLAERLFEPGVAGSERGERGEESLGSSTVLDVIDGGGGGGVSFLDSHVAKLGLGVPKRKKSFFFWRKSN